MELFDKFFTKFAYKFKKGYPDMDNPIDVALLESLISEAIEEKFSLKEASVTSNTKKSIEKILNSEEGKKAGLTKMANPVRIGNKQKISGEEFIDIIKKVHVIDKVEVEGPRTGDNKSGKFNLYKFKTEDGDVAMYLAGGGNEGEKYEQDFVSQAKSLAGEPNNTLPVRLQTLYKGLGIDNLELSPDDISFAGATDTKRSLNFEGPKDIGKTISDLTINYKGKDYYISLKNKAGSGIYSGKNIPFFVYEDGKVVYDSSKDSVAPAIDILFNIFNIDRERTAQGIDNYINQTGDVDDWSEVNINDDKFEAFLASSVGYGYYYVKEIKGDDVKVVPILTAQDALDAVGQITKAEIKYPGKNTKNVSVKLQADSPLFGPSQYDVVGRNTQGKILPMSLRITKSK